MKNLWYNKEKEVIEMQELLVDEIRNMHDPNKGIFLKLQNETYQITIRCLTPNYELHLKDQDFDPGDILISIHKKNPLAVSLVCLLEQPDIGIHECFGIECDSMLGVIEESKIEAWIEQVECAKTTIQSLRNVLGQYFPNVLKQR